MRRLIGITILSIIGIALILLGVLLYPPGSPNSILFLMPGLLVILWAKKIGKSPPKE